MNPALALRYQQGLQQNEVAERVGISRQTLWAIERGKVPTAPVAAKLAAFYGVSVAELLGHDDPKAAA